MIPNCYDPAYQDEQMQMEADRFRDTLPVCCLCKQTLYPGNRIYTSCQHVVCQSCKEDLDENADIVEIS